MNHAEHAINGQPQHCAYGELIAGLQSEQKTIDPKYFYDAAGSCLFDQITSLPEYYPTRTETAILKHHAEAIARHIGTQRTIIEPGAGSCEKIRHLIPALQPSCYVPVDISHDYLSDAVTSLNQTYPELCIEPVAGDFSRAISLPESVSYQSALIFYPGSTIGNFEPAEAVKFLQGMRGLIGPEGMILVGVDLHKATKTLAAAYNDHAGVTAAFNRNILRHLNGLLGADFEPDLFQHHAFYNENERRIEMHLVSAVEQIVTCRNDQLHFAAGESIHTENSYKYTLRDFSSLVEKAGLKLEQSWTDDEHLFSVNLLSVVNSRG
ncbi:L-histidine N(alpha)-methyltransferase [Haliea sp. E1-2-M8]|uniref:L-histidine N(alpha)-methyltransferase n=1 Tax=Haliea sp. E1-2-M8 TaxID=3064706 RepID=UPI002725F8C8|nr:L-histidine N(alpha)-methyltransferase [Haliea sp. E1-2-M8]MDO8861697.1 L-histidine N(alpha)-methyltransferase [Haliea sp. E1-2-M8]